MQIGFKYGHCNGFGKMYNYGLKCFNPYIIIAKEAKQRKKILLPLLILRRNIHLPIVIKNMEAVAQKIFLKN